MQFTRKTIFEIFAQKGIDNMRIPPYQRDYKWTEENCENLLKDIREAIQKEKEHFISPIYVKNYETYNDIIDGQQRITTIIIMMIAIRNTVEELQKKKLLCGYPYSNNELEQIKQEAKEYIYNENKEIRLQLHKQDMIVFNTLAKLPNDLANSRLNDKQKTNLIFQNYKYIKQTIEEWVQKKISLSDIVNAPKILYCCHITLENNDEAMSLFKRINSTGVRLDDVDLLRNMLIMPFDRETSDKIYEKYWEKIEQNVKNNSINKNMKKFLTAALPLVTRRLTIESETKTSETQVSSTFKLFSLYEYHYNRTNKNDADTVKSEKLLQNLLHYSRYYRELLEEKDFILEKQPLYKQKIYEFRNITECETADSFLMYLLEQMEKNNITEKEFANCVWPLTIYSLRSKVSDFQSNFSQRTMQEFTIRVFYKKEENKYFNISEYIWKTLIKDADSPVKEHILSRSDFQEYLKNTDITKRLGTGKNRCLGKYLLWIANKYINKKSSMQPFEPNTIGLYTIIPPSENSKWMKDLQIREWKKAKEAGSKIGNHFIDNHLSGIGTKPWIEKRKYMENSNFPLTREMSNESVWNFESVEKYSELIAKIITRHFSGPEEYENKIVSFNNKKPSKEE